MSVSYRVGARDPAAHLFDVELAIEAAPAGELTLRLPDWIPGSYMIRDYARHVVALSAERGGEALAVTKRDKSSWSLALAAPGDVRVALRVYAWDLSVRGAHLDQHHAYFNGTCLFPEVLGSDGPFELAIDAPAGLPAAAWVATSMNAVEVDERGFGRYRVDDYAELIDHPVEIAEQHCVRFDAAGIPHRFAVRDAAAFDHARVARDVAAICEAQHRLLGTPPDLDRYLFMGYALPGGYGGLEHRWSSSLVVDRDALPVTADEPVSEAYRSLLGLISHEYFHLWNVRRLKPAALSPPDLARECHTGLLWVFEGVTSYYDDLSLIHAGVIDEASYLELIGRLMTRVLRTPGRHLQSLEASSFDAWTRFYKQDENAVNAIVSYYQKGALAALALDLTLRAGSPVTLDDVMRECWSRFYLNGNGMPERGLEAVAIELSGLALEPFFERAIRGTDDIEFEPLLAPFGISLNRRASTGNGDKGGKPAESVRRVWSGLQFDKTSPEKVASVRHDSPAARAGVSAGDRLLAVDGYRADGERIDKLVGRAQPGDALTLTLFRGDRLLTLPMALDPAPRETVWLSVDESADAAASARRRAWLQPA